MIQFMKLRKFWSIFVNNIFVYVVLKIVLSRYSKRVELKKNEKIDAVLPKV